MERPNQKDGAYNDWQTEQSLTSDVSAHGVIFVFHLIAAGCPGNVRAEFRTARLLLDQIIQCLAQIGRT
jgi:hypothetical protein